MRKESKQKRWGSLVMAAALCVPSGTVKAQTLSYEAVTAMDTSGYGIALEALQKKLIVETVYAEAGASLQEGDQILKFTDESYQEVLKYYNALVIQAGNDVTNAELEYEKGLQEANYTVELARAQSDQADFEKEQSNKELEDTITEHEEAMTELEERIAELEDGIADGSYEASSGSAGGGSAFGTSQKSSGAPSSSDKKSSDKKDTTDNTEQGNNSLPDSPEQENTNTPGENTQENTSASADSSQKTSGALDNSEKNGMIEALKEQKTTLEAKLAEAERAYTDALAAVFEYAEAAGNDGQTESENGSRDSDSGTGDAQPSADGSEVVGEQELASAAATRNAAKETAQNANSQYRDAEKAYLEVLNQVRSVLAATGMDTYVQYVNNAEGTANTIASTYEEAFSQYETAISAYESALEKLRTQLAETGDGASPSATGAELETAAGALTEIKNRLQDVKTAEAERNSLKEQYESVTNALKEAEAASLISDVTGAATPEGTTPQGATPDGTTPQGATPDGTMPEGTMPEGTTLEGTIPQGATSEGATPEGTMPEGTIPEGTTPQGTTPEGTTPQGTTSGAEMPGASGFAGFGGGMSGGGMPAAVSSVQNAVSGTPSSAIPENGTVLGMQGNASMSGKTYDLSELKALLEQEPTDTDAAEELKEKLEEWQETVQLQYEELLRNQKAEKLKIEYTYETTVLEGQLAEVTYLETTSELEETLQAAKDALSDAEDIKEQLEAMTGGILTAEQSGYVASVAYEEGDTFYPTADILTFYDTSDVTLSIEVPQENIAEIAVGDAVSVDLGQYGTYEGRITEKMLEASEGNSRTEVTYAVTITAENTQGRLSAGISAEIEIETNADQEEKGDE